VGYFEFRRPSSVPNDGEKRCRPAECLGCEPHIIDGNPDPDHISTSDIGRQFDDADGHAPIHPSHNHVAAVALHIMRYNFVRIHQTLRVTQAMAAKVTDRLWDVSDIVTLLEAFEYVLESGIIGDVLEMPAIYSASEDL
jgi:hypothetical protein